MQTVPGQKQVQAGAQLVATGIQTLGSATGIATGFTPPPTDAVAALVFAATIKVAALQAGQHCLIPAGFYNQQRSAYTVIVVSRTGLGACCLAVVNTSPLGSPYHPFTIGSAENGMGTLYRDALIVLEDVDFSRVSHSAFWCMAYASLLYPGGGRNVECFYSRVLAFLNEKPFYQNWNYFDFDRVENKSMNAGDFEVPSIRKEGVGQAYYEPRSFRLRAKAVATRGRAIDTALGCLHYLLGFDRGLGPLECRWVTEVLVPLGMILRLTREFKTLGASTFRRGHHQVLKLILRRLGSSVSLLLQDTGTCTVLNPLELADLTKSVIQMALDAVQTSLTPQEINLGAGSPCFPAVLSAVQTEQKVQSFNSSYAFPFFGPFRFDYADSSLAAGTPVPPALVIPVDIMGATVNLHDKRLIRITSFDDFCMRLRRVVDADTVMHNQQALLEHSAILRYHLVRHTVLTLLPGPLPLDDPSRPTLCFYESESLSRSCQIELLRLLFLMTRSLIVSSLALKATRTLDAERIVLLSKLSAVSDAVLRKVAFDAPSPVSLHLAGTAPGPKGLLKPFGIDASFFAEQSEFFLLLDPVAAVCRGEVLDYFRSVKSVVPRHQIIFQFEQSLTLHAELQLLAQISLGIGYQAQSSPVILGQCFTGEDAYFLEVLPEFAFYRDIVLYFKAFCCPNVGSLPPAKQWSLSDTRLMWSCHSDFRKNRQVNIKAFGKPFECLAYVDRKRKSKQDKNSTIFTRFMDFFGGSPSRAPLSAADPTNLVKDKAPIGTEEDVLHVKSLPTFNGRLSQSDVELLLQYLTAPYLRIPLLLQFFTDETRFDALVHPDLQHVLLASLFEPSLWLPTLHKAQPATIPPDSREYLATPLGLLFNELTHSPYVVLDCLESMLEMALDKDTGKFIGSSAELLLFVIRMLIYVDRYVLVLLRHGRYWEHVNRVLDQEGPVLEEEKCLLDITRSTDIKSVSGHTSCARGLRTMPEVRANLQEIHQQLRHRLNQQVLPLLEAWAKRAVEVAELHAACRLHAHISLLCADMAPAEFNLQTVSILTVSTLFVLAHHRFTVEAPKGQVESSQKDPQTGPHDTLGVADMELYGILQNHRRTLVTWLRSNPSKASEVFAAAVRTLTFTGTRTEGLTGEALSWSELRTFCGGRFGPFSGLVEVMNAAAPTILDDMECRVAEDMDEGPSKKPSGIGTLISAIMPRARSGLKEENIESTKAKECLEQYEAWLGWVTGQLAETEIDLQRGKYSLRRNRMEVLELWVNDFADFVDIFGEVDDTSSFQCALISATRQRFWCRLVGYRHDLIRWQPLADPPRSLMAEPIPFKAQGKHSWVGPILDPWRCVHLPSAALMVDRADPVSSCVVRLSTDVVPPSADPDVRQPSHPVEIMVHRHPPRVELFTIHEHGRRLYRVQVYSSNCHCSARSYIGDKMVASSVWEGPQVALLEGGSTVCLPPPRQPSLVLTRQTTPSLGTEVFVPRRLLEGLVPSCLLSIYEFWQRANAGVHFTEDARTSVLVGSSGEPDSFVSIWGRIPTEDLGVSGSKPTALQIRILPTSELSQQAFIENKSQSAYPGEACAIITRYSLNQNSAPADAPESERSFIDLALADRSNAQDWGLDEEAALSLLNLDQVDPDFLPLVDTLLRVEEKSHILVWGPPVTLPGNPTDLPEVPLESSDLHVYGKQCFTVLNRHYRQAWRSVESAAPLVELIEMPRLGLTFRATPSVCGLTDKSVKVKYFCDQHAGLYVSYRRISPASLTANLIRGLQNSLLLENNDGDFFLLVSATAKPVRVTRNLDLETLTTSNEGGQMSAAARLALSSSLHQADSLADQSRTEHLLASLSPSIVLDCSNKEWLANLGCLSPKAIPTMNALNPPAKSDDWSAQDVVVVRTHLYPVHSSRSFLFTTTVGAGLYLVIQRFMARMYADVWRLMESSALFSGEPPTIEEKQLWQSLDSLNASYDFHPDAHATRLKIFLTAHRQGLVAISQSSNQMRKNVTKRLRQVTGRTKRRRTSIPAAKSQTSKTPPKDSDSFSLLPSWSLEEDLLCYLVKLSYVHANCRLSLAELRALIDLAGPQWTQSVENHPLTGNRLQTVQYYIHLAEGSRELQELSFRTPKIPEVTDFDGHVDESCIETSGSIADGLQAIMGAVVHFKPPDRPLTGVEALDYYLDLINRRPLNASTDFFTLYCLLTGQVQVSVLPHEGPYMWGVLATRLVGTWAKSSAMSALRVLASHPEIIQQMPPIPREKGKTRAWRDSFVFKQSEPVQKFYESLFGTLRSLHEGGQLRFRTNVKPCPSMAVPSWVLLMDPDCRTFRTSSLSSDFGCESRRLRPVNVASLCRKFHMDVPPGDPEKSSLPYITKSLLATLAEKPLPFTSQHALVSDVKGSSPGREAMDLPNRLKNHISAATRVGRETIKRFSAEIQAVQQLSKVAKPGQMSFLQLEEVERSLDSPEALAKVVQYAEMLKALLTKTFLQDGRFVDAGIKLVAQFANSARHVSSPDQLHYARSYEVGVLTGSEPVASFDALVTLLMSQSAETAIQRFNPFLSAEMTSDILSLVGTVLLIVNRRSQSARCLHDVIDLLENLARYPLSVDSAEREKLVSSTKMLSKSLATNLSQARHYAHTGQDDTVGDFVDWQTLGWSQDHTSLFDKSCFVALDPRFLVFEFAYNILLRKSQVELISKFVAAVKEGRSVCHQMIMGAGKTTVVGPLLALLLADGNRLVTQVCPHSLLEFTRAVVREKFSAVICKSVVTFQFSRSSNLTRDTLLQLHHARDNKSVVMASPTSLKSLFLKVLQLLDILETSASNMTEVDRVVVKGQQQIVRLRNVLGKVIGVRPAGSLRKPTRDDGILAAQVSSGQPLTEPQIRSVRRELDLALQALDLFTGGCLILDEVHILLHPFKSELHWPIGAKVPLDFTVASKDGAAEDHVEESGLRWQLVWHLYDAIFYFSTGKITCCAEHPRTKAVLENVKSVLVDGISLRAWQTTPHGILLSQAFYQQSLKPVLAQWALIFLESKGYKPRDAELVMNYICLPMAVDPSSDALAGQVMRRVDHQYRGSGAKLLNLTRMWLNSLLPHSLGKVNRVSFGLLLPSEVDPTANTPPTRQLLAVPFVGKDAPSLASEFSHPDVLIALTIAAYRLQGLRHSDFLNAISNLLEEVASSSASGMKISESRPVREFRRWVESAGGRVRGTKRVAASLSVSEDEEDLQTMTAEMLLGRYPRPPDVADRGGLDNTITMDAVTFNRLWSLELVDLLESDQVDTLYRLLWNEPLVIKHLLLYIVFPLCMEHTSLQLSACGQELGGNLIFKNRVGFSGTPSDMLPIEFGRCQFESGTDGTMLSLLTNPSVMHCIVLPTNWSVMSFLQEVANSAPQCLALIDTGALVTGFSNFDVASTLLDLGITVDGVAYLDEDDRQMLLVRHLLIPDFSYVTGDEC
ncbi:MAG: uncharacterized protein KVP18_004957 [Porospora cf. gigantea A]|uniref:uncharacterized protein n=1 Tax=Porospora cf. gigantea A TaxID=2853593 RepID=UPI00355AA1E5|nr:MAG: hypothetical protein KVP18_004957 [Porospora cf. gigantea A]